MNNVFEKIKAACQFVRKHYVLFLVATLILSVGINSIQLQRARRLTERARTESAELRAELAFATEANCSLRTELKSCNDKLLKCTGIVGELKSSSEQSTADIRQCILIVRAVRSKVQEMEGILSDWNTSRNDALSDNDSNFSKQEPSVD